MRTRSSFLLLIAATLSCALDATAQKAGPVAKPTTRRAASPGTPGDPLAKTRHTDREQAIASPAHTHGSTADPVLFRPGALLDPGKPMADQSPSGPLMRGTAPVNDNCANATLLSVGTSCVPVSGTVDQATQSIAAITCGEFLGNANDDVWYRFVAPGPTVTILLECNEFFDGVIDLRSGACNGTNIACGDLFGAGGSESIAATGLTPGTTYRFRVYDYLTGYPTDPSFTVCVYETPGVPANDLCDDAVITDVSVPGSASVSGDNTGALDTEALGFATVWEAFTIGACADVTIDYCGTDPAFGNFFGSLVSDCLFSEVIDATTDGDCGDGNLAFTYTALPAGTWYVPVLTLPGVAEGAYSFTITTETCGGGGAPPNDLCFDVTPSALATGASVFFNGTTENATNTNDGAQIDAGGDTVTVWHAFTTTECANIAVAYCGTAVLPDYYWAVLFDGCPADQPGTLYSGVDVDACADDNIAIFFNELPAGTWYLPVRGEPATWGAYEIEVSAIACANAGPYCDAGAAVTNVETISNVFFAGIDNPSTSGLDYEDFTAVTGVVAQGATYPIDITVDDGYETDQTLVWIDFDQSESFEPGELVFTSDISVGPYSGTIAIPGGATTGSTRMRIRLHDSHDGSLYQNTPNPTPCDTSTYGQVEDYTIVVTGGGGGDYNDECSDASPVLLTTGSTLTFTGDNTGCTNTEDLDFNSAWEAFSINECMNVTWDFCGSIDAMLVYTNIWRGCPWENFSSACGDVPDIICPNENTSPQATAQALPPGTYYIVIPYDDTYGGQYQINVTGTACTAPQPVNDECGGAISLVPGNTCVPVSGTTAGATQSLPNLECSGYTGMADDDVWYSFTATTPGGDIIATPTEELDLVIQLYTGVCGGFTPLACADGGLLGEEEVLTYTGLTVGTTYFYRVHGYYLGQQCEGFFSTCVTQDISTGASDLGQDPVRIMPNPIADERTITIAGLGGDVRVEILDLAGRLVQRERRVVSNGPFTLELSRGISAGIYTLRLITPGSRTDKRLVVK